MQRVSALRLQDHVGTQVRIVQELVMQAISKPVMIISTDDRPPVKYLYPSEIRPFLRAK